ncbi:MAG: cysteine peptidase family C39 domain-containing protein [Candidatus Nezhaarchaeales archaeon]
MSKSLPAATMVIIIISVVLMACYVLHLPEVTPERTNLWLKVYYDYVNEFYEPQWLNRGDITSYPQSTHVTGIPWISHSEPYCASTCLQMISHMYGINKSIGYFNFIMGFTYGAWLMEFDGAYFIPGSNPFIGYINASKVLGFKYHLLVTNDEDLFLDACCYYVSQGNPVILPVDMSVLYGFEGFAPHFELMVGYNADYFYIYEPVEAKSRFSYGELGIAFPKDLIAKAVSDFSKGLGLPWKYALIYFTKSGEPTENLKDVLIWVGQLQVGGIYYSGAMGSKAIEKLANLTSAGKIDMETYNWSMAMAYISRLDNSIFLRNYFHNNSLILEAAHELEEAAMLYHQILELTQGGLTLSERTQVVNLLLQATQHEARAGQLLIEAGSSMP